MHRTFTNHHSNQVLMSQMTAENAKSLMKIMHNHIMSHPHHSSYHTTVSPSHQSVDYCNRDTNTDHNADRRVHPHVIWINVLTLQFASVTHHQNILTPHHTPYTGHSTLFWVVSWRHTKSSTVSYSKVTLNPLTPLTTKVMTVDYHAPSCTRMGTRGSRSSRMWGVSGREEEP